MTLASKYDIKLTNLPQKRADLLGQNDIAAYRKSEYDSCIYDRKLTNCHKKCRFVGVKIVGVQSRNKCRLWNVRT
jgi:hypothetical protein